MFRYRKFLPVAVALLIGLLAGIVVQKYFPLGGTGAVTQVLKPLLVSLNVATPTVRNQPTPKPTVLSAEEYQQRANAARLASRIKRNDYGRIVHFYGDSI